MAANPSSWLAIEPGWKVESSDGSDLGYVDEVVGDTDKDVFNGLAISFELLGQPRYVPSERVGRIFEERVELLLTANEAQKLEEFRESPPSVEVSAEQASWSDRLLEPTPDVDSGRQGVPLTRRISAWLRSRGRRDTR
jgi:hypothetical protein